MKTRYIGKTVFILILWNVFLCQEKLLEKLKKQQTTFTQALTILKCRTILTLTIN